MTWMRNEMLRHMLTTLVALAAASTLVSGQQAPAPAAKPAEAPPGAQPARPTAQLVNVRIDLTVTEQREGSTVAPRTVTMLVADRESGRVRTGGGANAVLNVDARPELTRDGRIRLSVSLEYRREADTAEKSAPALLTESLTMIVEDGKQVLVSQSADPTTARSTVRVEVKATISK
jgi:hypothetical protein